MKDASDTALAELSRQTIPVILAAEIPIPKTKVHLSPEAQAQCRTALQMLADGQSLKDAAAVMDTTFNAMKLSLSKFYQLFGLDNRCHAVARGFREGWIK